MFSELKTVLLVSAVLCTALSVQAYSQEASEAEEPSRLAVLWSSGDPDVAHRVCLVYAHNAKLFKWFDEVVLIVWGSSARILSGDKDLQAKVEAMITVGVIVQACPACADSFGVSERLREVGIEVKYMGKPLTDMLKSDWEILTF